MRAFFWRVLKFFLFQLDAEKAHHLIFKFLKILVPFGNRPIHWISGYSIQDLSPSAETKRSRIFRVWDMNFESPLGLAAGFDKNAEIVSQLPGFGFGFAEIGTVTPLPQSGNERPRLFRSPADKNLFNRMGFNNLGAEAVAKNLENARVSLPLGFRVGVNLGKQKESPLENAAEDYQKSVRYFEGLADYLVINVSSPNTPGLRSLQDPLKLKPIVEGVRNAIVRWNPRPPLLLKLAPEIEVEDLFLLISHCETFGIDGWILTNTLAGSWPKKITADTPPLTGGWSGTILKEISRQRLKQARTITKLPIISVGGIDSVEEAMLRLEMGANLIQIYSAWIFEGPTLPAKISKNLLSFKTQ